MSWLGVDIGGTFTDLVLVSDDGEITVTKVPSTPKDLAQGAMDAIEKANIRASDVTSFSHGTTVATNVIIERNPEGKVVFLTTEGFSDIPEIMRTERENHYDRQWEKPDPLVPRHRRHGIPERVTVDGSVERPLDEPTARQTIQRYTDDTTPVSFAVSFLYSFLHPSHEQRLKHLINEELPDAHVSISSEIFPQAQEYERASTVIANAYVKPSMKSYLEHLAQDFRALGGTADITLMQSNGGLIPIQSAHEVPAKTLFSGPAAGVSGAEFFAPARETNIISLDMGGTSTDVGIVRDGSPVFTSHGQIEWGLPVQFSQIDIETVGAGGGSIGWVDHGGLLRVGPQSAGADPGPACYGRGGTDPTITDANLVLNRLNPENFLGGDITLETDTAETVVGNLGGRLNLSVEATALGILEIGMNILTQTIRTTTVERGHDPREFTLVAFGGAGPMHAGKVGEIANIPRVVIPPYPGVLSAAGLLTADFQFDQIHSIIKPTADITDRDLAELNDTLTTLVQQATNALESQGGTITDTQVTIDADLRYAEQAYDVTVPLAPRMPVTKHHLTQATDRFHQRHEQQYGHSSQEDPVELVNARVTVTGTRETPNRILAESTNTANTLDDALKETREVRYQDGVLDTPVYDRYQVPAGAHLDGPFIIEEAQSTTIGYPDHTGAVTDDGTIILEVPQ